MRTTVQTSLRTGILGLLFTAACSPALAGAAPEIYRTVDADGNVIYTDRAPSDPSVTHERITLPPPNRLPPPARVERTTRPSTSEPTGRGDTAADYAFSITEPAQDGSIRSNPGTVEVRFSVDPPVGGDHRIEILLDGAPRPETAHDGAARLLEVDRGTHDLALRVVDAGGRLLSESSPVRFHLHRATINAPTRAP